APATGGVCKPHRY
nr:Chain C, Histone H3.2 [Homo sapiens]7UVA_F Chain F, Histone H3.2 [Homo sapiens]